ncbi:MAG: aminotransferase class V-fold PLP-dependent enzyme [Coriobacteriales bacterium]|nr:aminotransferase class V-fold PLP-dependent enzyme [Actinomycetes bacterium]
MIYVDYAATSWPKPPCVAEAMTDYLEHTGGNPGRSGHRLSIAAARVIYEVREEVASLFGIADPLRVVFTPNVTEALNLAINGLLDPQDRVVTTAMEHNSVMRPLRALEKAGVEVLVVPCHPDGQVDLEAMRATVTHGTKLVVVNHASNVVGTIQPVADIATIAHEAGALLLLDAAQTAGALPIDQHALGVDLLAFTGHKALHGPTGTGGLVLGDDFDPSLLRPLVRGGTGSRSEFEEQPDNLPDKYESGTPNGVGIAGLGAAIKWLRDTGIHTIRAQEIELSRALIEGLSAIPGLRLYGPPRAEDRTAVISVTLEGWRVSEVGLALDDEYGILSRVGLHCSPAAHRTLGTFPEGTVRLSLGPANTRSDVEAVIAAMKELAESR